MRITYQAKDQDDSAAYRIPNGLRVGTQVLLRGRVQEGCEAFAVNLQQEEGGGDIALHFNPRPSEGIVVRNCYAGDWQSEERDQPHFPFDCGRSFLLRIEAAGDGFRTYVNGKPYIDFGHRMGMDHIRYLFLSSGAEFYDITIQDRYRLPYSAEIPGGMSPGKAIRVRGAGQDNDGFSLNFSCDPSNERCAFHFNPRPNEGVVIRNACLDGWGGEERDYEADFPFSPFQYFDAVLVANDDKYIVFVNDEYFAEFNHRCDVHECNFFNIRGNMDILDVSLFEPMGDEFVKRVPSGLEKGDNIVLRGFARPGWTRFAINFMNGDSPDDDIAFHWNPRMDEGCVVMNCKMGGDWENEEREDMPPCFGDGRPFEIKIVTKRNKFKIYCNGKKYMKFAARGDVESIKGLNVRGDVFIYQALLQRKLEKPAWERIPGQLGDINWIIVNGMPKKDNEGFAINLRCGDDDDSDIALHFNPRLNENCTIRNTMSGGSWGDEERDQPCFPFEKKDTFEVAINVQPDKFVTYVNGDRYVEYAHRLPLDSVCHVQLTGSANFYEPEFL
ncbi:hypothetical protein FSP39_004842 [Pinctada imbricata]|uniref:Galectin domain-containing protein n=2 Tax=Pinctada TaxID=50425 RepID=A0AA88XV22_PINIB|nr:galectin [Pinctada fucata]KAK3092599.1 hypothetical protein FSP39_004842 [Pinctada imbricata]